MARAQSGEQGFCKRLGDWGQRENVRTGGMRPGEGVSSVAASPCLPPSPRYYHTLFTHSLPKALRSLADDAPACVDVLMNFLVAAATKLPPIKVPCGKRHQEARPPLVRMEGHWEE